MSYPAFVSGDVLNASDMNAVGLWLVKTQTVGTGVTTVTVTGAFSADYDDYRIIYSGGTQSANGSSWLQLGSSATNYDMSLIYNVGATPTGATNTNSTWFSWVGGGTAGQQHHTSCDLFGPFLTQYTKMRNGSYQDGTQVGNSHGQHTLATSYTAFTIGGLTFTGGTIRVYGYRK
jgi:hypothetical protein